MLAAVLLVVCLTSSVFGSVPPPLPRETGAAATAAIITPGVGAPSDAFSMKCPTADRDTWVQRGQWIYISGTGFVGNQVFVVINENTISAHVYDANSGAFLLPTSEPFGATPFIFYSVANGVYSRNYTCTYRIYQVGWPIITGSNTNPITPGKWNYIGGYNFILGGSKLYVNGAVMTDAHFYRADSIGFTAPNLPTGTYTVNVTTTIGTASFDVKFA